MSSHKQPYRDHLDASIAWLMKNWISSNPTPVWVKNHLIQRASLETNSLRGRRGLRWLVGKAFAQYARLANSVGNLYLITPGRTSSDEWLARIHTSSDVFVQLSKQTTQYSIFPDSIFPVMRMINLT